MRKAAEGLILESIERAQRRKNGVVLGAVIGVVSMVPVSIALSKYFHNEGRKGTTGLVPIAVGLGAGIGIDAAVGSSKTLYERKSGRTVSIAPLIDPKGGIVGAWRSSSNVRILMSWYFACKT